MSGSAADSVPQGSAVVRESAVLEPIEGQRVHAHEAVRIEAGRFGDLPHDADALAHDQHAHDSRAVAPAAEAVGRSVESARPSVAAAVRANAHRTTIPQPALRSASINWRKLLMWFGALVVPAVVVIVWIKFTPTREQRALRWVVEQGGVARIEMLPDPKAAATTETAVATEPAEDEEAVESSPTVSVAAVQSIPSKPFRVVAVNLSEQKLDEAGLSRLVGLSDLRSLDLSRTPLTDAGLKSVGRLTGLKSLKLRGTKVTGKGLQVLAGLTQLDDLTVSGNKHVDDACAATLAKLPALRIALLSGTSLSDEGLQTLAQSGPKFERVGVARTNVTAAGIEAFRKVRPKCRVDATDGKAKK